MNHKYVTEQLNYHFWAQERTFTAVAALSSEQFTRDLGNSFRSIRDTLVHIHFAECVWYNRWEGASTPIPAAEAYPDLDSIRSASGEHEARLRALVERLGQDGINRSMEYTSTLDGRQHRTPFWQMFQHLINHGTYHRGQITMGLRQMGAEPVGTDLILFYWAQEQ